mgnify:CR=1 FL=1
MKISQSTSPMVRSFSSRVAAKNTVEVNALGIKDVDSIAASGALGLIGLAGSVSVWSVGQALSSNYQGDGGAPANSLQSGGDTADGDAAQQGSDASGKVSMVMNGDGGSNVGLDTGAHNVDTANTSQNRTSAISYSALNGTGGTHDGVSVF